MTGYLLDTNHASLLMADEEPLRSRVKEAQSRGDRFGLSIPVLGELYHAVFASRRRERNMDRLQRLRESTLIWLFDEQAAEMYGVIQAEQRAKGKPIVALDAQIAAVARLHGLTVLTADRHFAFVSDLSVENWLEAPPFVSS